MSRDNYSTPPGIREPRRLTWLPYAALAAAVILLGVIVANECWAAVEALVEPDRSPPTHQLWSCTGATTCKPHGEPMGRTACLLDAASLANTLPSGSKVACQRVKATKP